MKTESRAPTAGAMRAARQLRIKIHNLCGSDNVNSPENPANAKWLDSVCPDDAEIIDRETGCRQMAEALKAIVGWCDHPSHGGQYDLPKPLLPYVIQCRAALEKAGQP